MKKPAKRVGLTSVQIRPQLEKNMKFLIKRGMTKSQIINEAVHQYLIEKELQILKEQWVPLAQSKGIYTEEDVYRILDENRS